MSFLLSAIWKVVTLFEIKKNLKKVYFPAQYESKRKSVPISS